VTPDPTYRISISGTRKHLEQTRELVHFVSTQHGLDIITADLVEVAIGEACDNALRHGKSIGKNQSYFDLELSINDIKISAVIIDSGEPFDFDQIEPFNINQDFMAYKNGGLGIPLIKAIMDEVHYVRKSDNTNELILIKHLGSGIKNGRKRK